MSVKVLEFFDVPSVEKFVGMNLPRLKILAFTVMVADPENSAPDKFYLIVDLEPQREQASDCQLVSVSGSSILRSGK